MKLERNIFLWVCLNAKIERVFKLFNHIVKLPTESRIFLWLWSISLKWYFVLKGECTKRCEKTLLFRQSSFDVCRQTKIMNPRKSFVSLCNYHQHFQHRNVFEQINISFAWFSFPLSTFSIFHFKFFFHLRIVFSCAPKYDIFLSVRMNKTYFECERLI